MTQPGSVGKPPETESMKEPFQKQKRSGADRDDKIRLANRGPIELDRCPRIAAVCSERGHAIRTLLAARHIIIADEATSSASVSGRQQAS